MSYRDPESVAYDGNETEPKEKRLKRAARFIGRLCDRIILNNTTYFHGGGLTSHMSYRPGEGARAGQIVPEIARLDNPGTDQGND